MATAVEWETTIDDEVEVSAETPRTVADLLESLGDVPPDRVLLQPAPGTATEADLQRLPHDMQRMCELIDGTLVMKAMGAPESLAAFCLAAYLAPYMKQGLIAAMGPDGHTRYFGNQIRMPDVAVFLRSRLPGGKMPKEQICPVAPDWTVEVLSPGNTRKETAKKLKTYFESGVRLAWVADPRKRTVRVYTSPENFKEFGEDASLDAGDILPGFKLSIREWFDSAE
jgi:Uma2 family endonuclease